MKIINCPQCYGTGIVGRIGRCGYCHGKKKVNSDFVKWNNTRGKLRLKLLDRYEEQMLKLIKLKVDVALEDWELKNPKPRKFPKIQKKRS